jgi:hypothetical protein
MDNISIVVIAFRKLVEYLEKIRNSTEFGNQPGNN